MTRMNPSLERSVLGVRAHEGLDCERFEFHASPGAAHLERIDFDVTEARTVKDALAILERDADFNLVSLDWNMPGRE